MTSAPKRRWFSFSLRTLFVVVTVFGCWLGPVVYHARHPDAVNVANPADEAQQPGLVGAFFSSMFRPMDGLFILLVSSPRTKSVAAR